MSKSPYDLAGCPEKSVILESMIAFDKKALPGRIIDRYYAPTYLGLSIDFYGLAEELRHHGIDDDGLRSLGVPGEVISRTCRDHNFA